MFDRDADVMQYVAPDGGRDRMSIVYDGLEFLTGGEIHLWGRSSDGREIHVYVVEGDGTQIWDGKRPASLSQ
jgi:hypothetical protein